MDSSRVFTSTILVNEFTGTIECLAYYSQRVLIGTKDGRLILYDMRKGGNSPVASYTFPHRKSITQITAIPHIRSILVLCNKEIHVFAATDLERKSSQFEVATGTLVFTVNQRGPPHYRVCAVLSSKVMLFELKDSKYILLREFPIVSQTTTTPDKIVWYRNKIILAYPTTYTIMNDKSGDTISVIDGAIINGKTVLKLLPHDTLLLSSSENTAMFMDLNGNAMDKNPLSFKTLPKKVVFSLSYLVAHVDSGLEIHSLHDSSLVQVGVVSYLDNIFMNLIQHIRQ